MVEQLRNKVSEMHVEEFPDPSTFQCCRFGGGAGACREHTPHRDDEGSVPMGWIREHTTAKYVKSKSRIIWHNTEWKFEFSP